VNNFLNVVTTVADTGSVTLDGGPLPLGAWQSAGDYGFAMLWLADGSHVVEGSQPVGARVYGFRPYWSYGYYSRSDTASAEPPPVEPPENPVITSVTDVPNDQGRKVRLVWAGSSLDTLGSPEPIVEYALYRRHDPDLKSDWDYIGDVPAFGGDSYAVVVPTLADSTISEGQYWSYFLVRAATAVPTRFFDSKVDSGYSVDNLAPAVPTSLLLAGGVLTWDEAEDADFRHFSVYGSPDGNFGESVTLIGHTVGTSFDVSPAGHHFYHLTATDFAGNESGAATWDAVSAVPDPAVTAYALLPNHPNPFNPQTTIAFDLPERRTVRLTVFDVTGRVVDVLIDDAMAEQGRNEVVWRGRDLAGRVVSAGIYFYRLEAGDFSQTNKMTLLK
jgi:hypothetical protein